MELPIDIEDALQGALNGAGLAACAPPLPERFEAGTLPLTLVSVVGGRRTSLVRDEWRVSLDTYAETEQGALAESRAVLALVSSLAGGTVGGAQCYAADPIDLPHGSHDADHPDLAVATFWAEVATRCRHI